ncbi:hypothetical protein QNH26_17855 [Peribacillus frigoritolerans]|uniref:hypothetical protein n=1 Tax=Peribacillus frigoritolerans TaxID=450367 RepID=UPI0024C184E0|nr:hypothetical protein [Peribacillus frigoritolerans]WHX65550.1 hypothetical protein QNH26_17855 [Peribacillus frigoritolerans]
MIGTEGPRLLREMRVQGRPRRREASRRLTDRPRKASAWSGNQRFKFYKQKNCSQTRFSSNISPVSLGVPIGLILNHDFKTRLDYSSCFFTVILNRWKKFATLLPNYWLAETPQPLGEEAWQTVGGKGADF